MRVPLCCLLALSVLSTGIVFAADATDQAIKKDQKRTQGTWQVTAMTINGGKAKEEDAKKFQVVNGKDGLWSILAEGKVISKGTSSIDPAKKPKTIDFTPTEGGGIGDKFLGIYQLKKNTRKLCFAPAGKARPTTFESTEENKLILVTFKRVKPDSKN